MTQSYRLQHLFQKYLHNSCTEPELEELAGLLNEMEDDELDAPMKALWEKSKDNLQGHQVDWQKMYDEVTTSEESLVTIHQIKRRNFRRLWINTVAAASAIIAVTTASYLILHNKPIQQTAKNELQNIKPGHNQATLTLAGGKKIILSKGLTGKLALQGNTLVQINSRNALTYTITGKQQVVEYNTMNTDKGEQSPFPLILADGTKVWLNAESSITFPTSFNGKERIVKITGEAYFEVVHNANRPFKVTANGQTVEDLGTHFNINTYIDEPVMKTTLIQGSIKISRGTLAEILKPGQEAIISQNGEAIKVQPADIDQAVAWKNGDFAFEGTPLRVIMRQISRWYDVDISYQGAIADGEFGGSISRSKNITEVLNVLESTQGVHFKIVGRRILVMP